jgi:hypothetical protein
MAKPRVFTEKYKELEKAAKAMNETKDCAVKAMAVIGDLPYDEAHCLLEMHGRLPRHGTWNHITRQALKFMDLKTEVETELWRDIMGGKTIRTLGRVMKGVKGKFIVWTSQHVLAIEDGEVHDWTNGRLHRIERIERVTPMSMAANNEDES